MTSTNRIYFNGLDSLRAIGALSVILGHIELSKKGFGLPNLMEVPFFKHTSGHLGVILFFVLSGFLITFLLLKEKSTFQTIAIRKFYFRRALRIWPIYYLALTLLIFIIPNIVKLEYFAKPNLSQWQNLLPTILIYLFMAPNFVAFGIPGIGGGFHLGSIGTEEQFYIIWPVIILWFRNILIPLLFILIIIPLMPHACDYLSSNFVSSTSNSYIFLKELSKFFTFFKISCMAIGGFFAWILFTKNLICTNFFYSIPIQLVALIGGFGGWVLGIHVPEFNDEIYGVLFGVVILNTASNPKSLISWNYRISNYLGKISYGIYVYHWMILYLVLNWLVPLNLDLIPFNTLAYLLTFGLTIGISHISYFYFELWFLKFKDQFTKVKSYDTYGK